MELGQNPVKSGDMNHRHYSTWVAQLAEHPDHHSENLQLNEGEYENQLESEAQH